MRYLQKRKKNNLRGNYPCLKSSKEWIKTLFDRSPPSKCVIRVDAGNIKGLSFGHLVRCLTISKLLWEIYCCKCIFLMRNYPEGIAFARQNKVTVKTIQQDEKDENNVIINICKEFGPEWLIVDLPYLNMDFLYFSEIKQQNRKICYIDDNHFKNPGADVYLNSNILARSRIMDKDNSEYYVGPEYFIFDETLKDYAVDTFNSQKTDKFLVLLSFGGADPTNLTEKVIDTFLGIKCLNLRIDVIIGPGFSQLDMIKTKIYDGSEFIKLVINPPNIIPFFQRSDFIICAGGRTMYELLYLQKNFLPIASIEHEKEAIKAFISQGFIDYGLLEWNHKTFLSVFNDQLRCLNIK